MIFSKEDKAVWNSSEVMKELETLAKRANEIEENSKKKSDDWEEENFIEALDEFEKPNSEVLEETSLKDELHLAYNISIIDNLQKIADHFIDKSNIKVAYRIEQAINELKDCFRRKF